jgi:hypothetical protein
VPQNRQLQFDDYGIKITATVSLFGSQNQSDFGLSVALQNQWEGDSVGHASRSNDLFRVKASRARIFQFTSKVAEAQRRVVHVAPLQMSCED